MIDLSYAEVQAAFIAAMSAVISSMLTLIISSHYSRSALLEEWNQRNKEWERESARRDRDWARDKITEFYSGAVYYLKKLSMSAKSKDPDREKQVRQHVAECYRYISLLEIYIRDLGSCLSDAALDLEKNLHMPDALAEAADKTLAVLRNESEKHPILGKRQES